MKRLIRVNFKRIWNDKPSGSIDLTGCTWDQLYNWLQFTLPSDYNMNDIGTKLQIDHVIPLSSFNQEDTSDACKWYNLQLLTKEDNLKKSNNISQYHINIQSMRLAIIIFLF